MLSIKPMVPRVACYVSALDKISDESIREKQKEIKKLRLHKRLKYVVDPPQRLSESDGEKRYKGFVNFLENGFKEKRHIFQREFHRAVCKTLAPQIVGPDWEVFGPILAKKEGWDLRQSSQILLGLAPRRFGKSTGQAMSITSYMVHVPKSEQSIFSTAQRISMYLGEMVYKFICDAGLKEKVVVFRKERLEIVGDHPEDLRILNYFPGNAKVNRKKTEYPLFKKFTLSFFVKCPLPLTRLIL